ncbi:4Fe-4S dicluster domain-containing protein [Nocardioides sp.]|uniref:4Fe-4S dicluster domain-containing protein n=1 Tax=Nocardioides sp. TaxID=35761 RepID=UPI00273417FF|nr:4Fe-4S dicluster domain-containing protein [Nocardioides sp.]MDP3894208.1 4Fe-4S dicluster domain-containing protein [Nocardioides sp.]
MDIRLMDVAGLQALIDALGRRGYTVLGPTVRNGAIANAPVRAVADLPVGWGDDQDAAHYRLRRREDDAVFGFASGAQSAKPVFFPTEEVLWRGRRTPDGFDAEAADPADEGPYALLGVRSCDLHAVGIHDTVLRDRGVPDGAYVARREGAFVVAVTCGDPGGTCFCASMDTGPRPRAGHGAPFDLALTELLDDSRHHFLVEIGSDRGTEIADEIGASPAGAADIGDADRVAEQAAGRMGRTLDTAGLKELLYASADSPVWNDVAERCLACGNCTAVCPTCFCTSVDDMTDLSGDQFERTRVWDSCFNADFSHLHGGNVRESTSSRYRQWMTHKLGSWIDQFGMSGCVGCGRCVTWCPAAIDITEEVAALRQAAGGDG